MRFYGDVLIWVIMLFVRLPVELSYGWVPTRIKTESGFEASNTHILEVLEAGGGGTAPTPECGGIKPALISSLTRDWAAFLVESGEPGLVITINPALHDGDSSFLPSTHPAPSSAPQIDIEKYVISLSFMPHATTSNGWPLNCFKPAMKGLRWFGSINTLPLRSWSTSCFRSLAASTSNPADLTWRLAISIPFWAKSRFNCLSLASLSNPCAVFSWPVPVIMIRVATTTNTVAIAAIASPQSISWFQKSTEWLRWSTRRVRDWISDTFSTSDLVPLASSTISPTLPHSPSPKLPKRNLTGFPQT
jgi:hypothetical protein